MPGAKVVVIYPSPTDVPAFERAYTQDHAPMVTAENFKGISKFVASKVVGTPDGSPAPFHRIAELHFPSMAALQAAAASAFRPARRRPRRVDLDGRDARLSGSGRNDHGLLRSTSPSPCGGFAEGEGRGAEGGERMLDHFKAARARRHRA